MVTEGTGDFSSAFDYHSVFQYGSVKNMKSFNRNDYKSAFSYHAIPMSSEDEIDQVEKEARSSLILRHIIIFILYLIVIPIFPLSAWFCIKKINSLERIVLMRLGKLQPIRGPGFAFILPCIDVWTRVDLRPKIYTLSSSELLTADGGIIEVHADIKYQTLDVIKYVMKLHEQENTVKDLGLFCLKNILSQKDQEDIERNREIINCILKDELNNSVLNWGLEVISVCIHRVKILKAAEPVNAVETLITALKVASGQSSQDASSVFSLVSFPTDCSMTKNIEKKPSDQEKMSEDFVGVIEKLADNAERKGLLNGLTANFKLDIIGKSPKAIYLCFTNGHVSVFEGSEHSVDFHVSLSLTEENLRDFLNLEISPIEAYMDGKVMVTGDWSLLRSLAKIFA